MTLRYFAYHTAQILADLKQWFNVLMVQIVYKMQLHSPACDCVRILGKQNCNKTSICKNSSMAKRLTKTSSGKDRRPTGATPSDSLRRLAACLWCLWRAINSCLFSNSLATDLHPSAGRAEPLFASKCRSEVLQLLVLLAEAASVTADV